MLTQGGQAATRSARMFSWQVQGKPVSVVMNERVGHVIQSYVPASISGARPPEIGGVLLGRVQELSEGQWLVQIQDFELLDCERAWSESYTLTMGDKAHWSRRVRQLLREGKEGYVPVGWFRTHTRKGLYMDQHDFDLMRLLFAHPSSIAMVIRPGRGADPGTAGLFIWEGGDIERAQPQEPFAFPPQGVGVDFDGAPVGALAPEVDLPPLVGPVRQPKRAWLWATVAAGALAGILWQPPATVTQRPERVLEVINEAAGAAPVLPTVPTVPAVNDEVPARELDAADPEVTPSNSDKEPDVIARRRGVQQHVLKHLPAGEPKPAPTPRGAA